MLVLRSERRSLAHPRDGVRQSFMVSPCRAHIRSAHAFMVSPCRAHIRSAHSFMVSPCRAHIRSAHSFMVSPCRAHIRSAHFTTSLMRSTIRQLNPHSLSYQDRKSTRLNSSHLGISYAVFCLKK